MGRISLNPMDRKLVILSEVVLSAQGAMFYNLLPLFLGVAQDYRDLDNRSIGLLGSVFFAGFTLTTGTAFFWIRRINWITLTWMALSIACKHKNTRTKLLGIVCVNGLLRDKNTFHNPWYAKKELVAY